MREARILTANATHRSTMKRFVGSVQERNNLGVRRRLTVLLSVKPGRVVALTGRPLCIGTGR